MKSKTGCAYACEIITEPDNLSEQKESLPPAFETRLSGPASRIGKAAAKINFMQTLGKEVVGRIPLPPSIRVLKCSYTQGGHTFSRKQRGPKHTVLIEHAFSKEQTAKILARCKTNKVTVNHAISAICNVAWGRITSQSKELPM